MTLIRIRFSVTHQARELRDNKCHPHRLDPLGQTQWRMGILLQSIFSHSQLHPIRVISVIRGQKFPPFNLAT